jgi:hypothetical protein
MTRTAKDVFSHHWDALIHGDVPRVLEDYADDAVLLTTGGVFEGREDIGGWFSAAVNALPEAEWAFSSTVYSGDALLLHWTAVSPQGRIDNGVDTFVITDGKIRLQTVSFTVTPV